MSKEEQRAVVDAIGLLRLLVNQAIAEKKGLEDEEDVVGVVVVPATAQIDLSTPRYNAAIEQLLEWGALARDDETDETNELLSNVPGVPEAVKITREGLELLRNTGV